MKACRFTTLLALLSMAAATAPALADLYSTTVLADSPVAYWRLGEASGSTAYDSSGYWPTTLILMDVGL
jgi:hypothetical protein